MKARESLAGARVTVMGLGLHGGGVSSARFLAREGADVTVTDLRSEEELAASVASLGSLPIRFVLGRHEDDDFSSADIVIKNPAVRRHVRHLALARRIETDISLFLARSEAPVLAVTGTKGKSSTSSAAHHILDTTIGNAFLGGNITRSPLEFLADLGPDSTVVLELSSFQLGDLTLTPGGAGALRARVAIITSIFRDHLNYYGSMEAYVADKRQIYTGQGPGDWTIARDDDWGRSFLAETPARGALTADSRPVGFAQSGVTAGVTSEAGIAAEAAAWLDGPRGVAAVGGAEEAIVPKGLLVPGIHMRRNLLAAGLACRLLGVGADAVLKAAGSYAGIGHRLELVRERSGVRFYNDSAATIPEATLEAVGSFDAPVHLIAGGTDKNIDFRLFATIASRVHGLYLLEGNATEPILEALGDAAGGVSGPYPDLEQAVVAAAAAAGPGEVVILSPGCASFGMFQNEFDRGRRFRDIVGAL